MAGMQDKDIYKRPYVRPNENWVCGLASEGRPCPHGPSVRGKCTAQHECKPAQVGERWVCTRPEQYGGPCDDPSLPEPSFGPHVLQGVGVCCRKVHCTPQRSLRAKRGRLSVILCSAIAGIVLFALGGPWRDYFVSPGPLTAAHQGASMASLEAMAHGKMDTGAAAGDRAGCHICHTAADGGLATLLGAAWERDAKIPQSNQCLECHGDDIGEAALFAHALDPAVLALHTVSAAAEPFKASKPFSLALASLSPGVKMGDAGEMACAACHREHNGAFFDLKRMDNQQCQTCHVKQFDSMANGHPEFSTLASAAGYDYPYRRRTRIVYDHASHERDYFRRAENLAHAPADCTACHEISDVAHTTALKPFEQMCAACHTGNIVAGRDEWIHVLGFPSMEFDAYAVVEEETEARDLPRTARKGVSPFMLLLQSAIRRGDPDGEDVFQSDLAMVQEFAGDLSGIVFDEDPEVVGRLFEGSKAVLREAADADAGGLREAGQRLLGALGGDALDPARFDAMFGFPAPGDTVDDVIRKMARKDIVELSGWHVVESGYRVDAAAWAGALGGLAPYAALGAAAGDGEAGPYVGAVAFLSNYSDFKDWFNENFRVQGGEWILQKTGKEAKKDDWASLLEGAFDWPTAGDEAPAETDERDAGAEDEPAGTDSSDSAADEAAPKTGTEVSKAGEAFVDWLADMANVKRWMEANFDLSGDIWTLRAPQSLYYRPVQHADPFLTAWIDFAGSIYSESGAAAMLFDELTGRRTGLGIGACTKCHSIDVEKNMAGDAAVRVNWKSKPPHRDFTKFNHSPHLKLMDCAQCHRADWIPETNGLAQLARAASAEEEGTGDPEPEGATAADAEAIEEAATDTAAAGGETPVGRPDLAYLDSFKVEKGSLEIGVNFSNRDHDAGGYAFVSSFEPVTKDDCARCHVPGKAGDSCLICHNYHVESVDWSAGVKSLSDLLAAKATGAEPGDTGDAPAEEVAPVDAGETPAEEIPVDTGDLPAEETAPAESATAE